MRLGLIFASVLLFLVMPCSIRSLTTDPGHFYRPTTSHSQKYVFMTRSNVVDDTDCEEEKSASISAFTLINMILAAVAIATNLISNSNSNNNNNNNNDDNKSVNFVPFYQLSTFSFMILILILLQQ